jgi:long-chain acyl-CoA synthetase
LARVHAIRTAPAPVVGLIHELADFAAGRYRDAPFLLRHAEAGWQSVSFAEAARALHAFAALLEHLGVGPGARVGLQSENRPEWGLAYLAVLEAGGVVVPLDPLLQISELREILGAARAAHCIVSARTVARARELRARGMPDLRLACLDEDAGFPSWSAAQGRGPVAARPPRGAPDDLAVLLFTSGTTGRPKGVMLSHRNILSNVEAVADRFRLVSGDRLLSVLPLHHTFECTAGFLAPLRVGASVATARGLKSIELREDLSTSGATLMLGVPLLYEKLLAAVMRAVEEARGLAAGHARAALALSRALRRATGLRPGGILLAPLRAASGMGRIRVFVSGAAPLPPEVFRGFTDLGWRVIEGYGLTECSPVVTADHPEDAIANTVGRPLAGVEVRIADPDEAGDGEVLVRGQNVMLGYHEDHEATAAVLRDGWFHTGDLGRIIHGRLRITGRLKNMIATAAGKKIYPEEVETRLAGCPYIREVVVVGARDPRTGREEVQAHVFPDRAALEALAAASGRTLDESFVEEVVRREVESRCLELAPYKRVKRVIVRRDEFPRTSTGKIRRQGLVAPPREAAESGEAVA